MFTNWLTNSSLLPPPPPPPISTPTTATVTAAGLIHTPPDVILKVGPSPGVHFVAHSNILLMHSGYLRSTLQIDDRGICKNQLPIHLTNITADQFAPLLTYMYTGYLDLRIENIFGILLATHVLHIPRALDLCRDFLARTTPHHHHHVNANQLSTSTIDKINHNHNNEILINKTVNDESMLNVEHDNPRNTNCSHHQMPKNVLTSNKDNKLDMNLRAFNIIRPIPSKPTISNFGVIVPPAPHILLPSSDTPFRSLNVNTLLNVGNNNNSNNNNNNINNNNNNNDDVVDDVADDDNDENIQNVGTFSGEKCSSIKNFDITTNDDVIVNDEENSNATIKRKNKSNNYVKKHDIEGKEQQIRKHFVTCVIRNEKNVVTTNVDNKNDKIIIDIASCDGPVKFRRVLNDAYEHNLFNSNTGTSAKRDCYSIQQQIEKSNLNNQQSIEIELNDCDCKEKSNEKDGDAGGCSRDVTAQNYQQNRNIASITQTTNDIFSCVYCKHTFKSQYCYEKHAKRHLNPLIIETSTTNSDNHSDINQNDKDDSESIHSISVSNDTTNKREVKPLDMNVQYYPCKTCGCKFPSYYFVHKHRKLCHASENINSNSNSNSN